MHYDCIIVGAGPAGLSAAIRYAQLCNKANKPVKVCVLEKGSEVGAHILSGAVFDPRALTQLIGDWENKNAPIQTKVTLDEFLYLSKRKSYSLPTPPQMKNQGYYIISLGLLCRWLAEEASMLGVEIYTGFPAAALIRNEKNTVIGIKTGDFGKDKNHSPKPNYQAGAELYANYVLLAEGCRGSLTQIVIKDYHLQGKCPQTYALGLKEIWEVPKEKHQSGKVVHTVGWPLDSKTYGGSFIYHWGNQLVSIGLVVGLDYQNPYFDPYEAFQLLKCHPNVSALLENGQCISYGARALNEGGWQSLPHLTFPGGLILGCAAGFLNVPQLKGSHNAMLSGILAAESIFDENPKSYTEKINQSWIAT